MQEVTAKNELTLNIHKLALWKNWKQPTCHLHILAYIKHESSAACTHDTDTYTYTLTKKRRAVTHKESGMAALSAQHIFKVTILERVLLFFHKQ